MSKLANLLEKAQIYTTESGSPVNETHSLRTHTGLQLIHKFNDAKPIDMEMMNTTIDFKEQSMEGRFKTTFFDPDGDEVRVEVIFTVDNEVGAIWVNGIPTCPTPRTRGALWYLMYSLATGRAD